MHALRRALAVGCWVGLLALGAAAHAQAATAKQMLAYQPTLPGVDYDRVPEQAVDGCKVEVVSIGNRAAGWALRDSQGKMLRRFVDGNNKGRMDQWSYYQDGFEVYREIDLDGDMSPDECRWLNAGGTRIASVARVKGSKTWKVTGWKRLSAEEASKVLVQAIVTGDQELLETVIAQADELAELGAPKAAIDKVTDAAAKRTESVAALSKSVVALGWNSKTVWNRLDGLMPHLIPADPGSGLKQDAVLYENAVVFAGPPIGQANPGKFGFLQAPEMIKLGDTWKFVELPHAIDPEKPVVAVEGAFRAGLAGVMEIRGPGGSEDPPAFRDAKAELTKYTSENAHLLTTGKKEDLARYHVNIIKPLNQCVKTAPNDGEKLAFQKEIINNLATAYQTGKYPSGKEVLNKNFVDNGGTLAGLAAYALVSAEFGLRNEDNPGELLANQKKWMDDLKAFIEKYPDCEKVPDAYYSLAAGNEFLAEEEQSRKYYAELRDKFPDTSSGKKAAGALKRLDMVGKPLELKGPGLDKETVDLARYKGKAVLLTFWASWAEPVKRDLPELLKLYEKNKARGFEIVGINLDNDRAELDAFLKANNLPWPEIFEEGGMESRLAVEYGIISLPTMILVDPEGKVANRNIRSAAEVEKQLDKVVAGKRAGVALGRDQ